VETQKPADLYNEDGTVKMMTDEQIAGAVAQGVVAKDLMAIGLQGQAQVLAEFVQGIHLAIDLLREVTDEKLGEITAEQWREWLDSVHESIVTASKGVEEISTYTMDAASRVKAAIENGGTPVKPSTPNTGFYL
jgi:hypothetical protein